MDFGQQAIKAKRTAELREKAGQLVAQTFFGTLMRQMRQSPWKSELFGGGRGGEAYQQLLDQKLVEHMARGVGSTLVESIVKRWSRDLDKPAKAKPKSKDGQQSPTDAQQLPTPANAPASPSFQQRRPITPQDMKRQLHESTQPAKRYGPTSITA